MNGGWVPHDLRDEVVDFVNRWRERAEMPAALFVRWMGIGGGKYYEWVKRYGRVNEHNGKIPRDHWLDAWEKRAIIEFFHQFPDEGYRRLTYMMMDRDIVAVSPASVWRVLNKAGLLKRWGEPTKKGKGFEQPLKPHEHWHVDISYINIYGTFYYLCSVLDGCSRYIISWDIKEAMKESDVEIVIQRAKEKYPDKSPRIITDNGSQFIAKDFKEFIRISGMTHVKTSPYYPQSNGKIERWHGTLKKECIREKTPVSLEDARRIVTNFVSHYNNVRLHSAIGYVAPADKLEGRDKRIWEARDRKLDTAREQRRQRRLALQIIPPVKAA